MQQEGGSSGDARGEECDHPERDGGASAAWRARPGAEAGVPIDEHAIELPCPKAWPRQANRPGFYDKAEASLHAGWAIRPRPAAD